MSDIVEELLHKYGLLERPKKPKIVEGEVLPRYRWRLLRNCIRNVADQVSREEQKETTVTHGIQFLRKISHTKPINQILYISERDEYITLDGEYIRLFHGDGRRKDVLSTDLPFSRLVFASQINQFVGWTPGSKSLLVLTPDTFQVITESVTSCGLSQIIYNEDTGEMVTCEPGSITCWAFRFGNRHLLPKRRISESPRSKIDHIEDDSPSEELGLKLIALERSAGRRQRFYGAMGYGVRVYCLRSCRLLKEHKAMHDREITAVTYFNPLKYLVTGSLDGSIKVWDDAFLVRMVFVGHNAAVSSLCVYPFGAVVMSASQDTTIRVWSLEIDDEIDRVLLEERPVSLGADLGREVFHTVGESCVDLWKINQIHVLHTAVMSPVLRLHITTHPNFPPRVVLTCQEGVVHIVIPSDGQVITSAVNPIRPKLLDSVYLIEDDQLFCLFEDGSIRKFDTSTNPCQVTNYWPRLSPSKKISHLLAYEYVISSLDSVSSGSSIVRNKTVLIGARSDGHLCVLHGETGAVEFAVEAHGSRPVLCLVANVQHDQVISAGEDNVIKVWRVFPFASESLSALMSFFCANVPLQLAIYRYNLVVCFEDPSTAIFTNVVYNLETRSRFDHSPEDDHMDSFTDVSCCPRLKLVVTASMDGTLRVWDEKNRLVRVLQLHMVPWSVSFCSSRGDLLVGVGAHLYRIDHRKFLPSSYLRKMVMMMFPEETGLGGDGKVPKLRADVVLEMDQELLDRMAMEDVRRLQVVRPAFRFTQYDDVISDSDRQAMLTERRKRDEAFAKLDAREEEIRLIRDGLLKPSLKTKSTKATRAQALRKYLEHCQAGRRAPTSSLAVPEDVVERQKAAEEYQAELDRKQRSSSGKDKKSGKTSGDSWVPEPVQGFFPPLSQAKTSSDYFTPAGFIPNSVLVKLLWPAELLADKMDTWKPPEISASELALMAEVSVDPPSVADDTLADTTLVFDWDEDDDEQKEDEDVIDLDGDKKAKKKPPPQSSFMAKMQEVMEKPRTPPEERLVITSSRGLGGDDGPPISTPDIPSTPKPTPGSSMRNKMMRQEAAKIKAAAAASHREPTPPPTPPPQPKKSVTPKPPTPPPPKELTPPPPPLPSFVTRFSHEPWYLTQSLDNLPTPLTPSSFCAWIAGLLRSSDWPIRCCLCQAIVGLYQSENIASATLQSVKYSILSLLDNQFNIQKSVQRDFLKTGLNTMVTLGMKDRDIITEFLLWYLEGDEELQTYSLDGLTLMGKNDPKGFLVREMSSWDLLAVSETNRRGDLRRTIELWLDKWLQTLKKHIKDTVERLRKGDQVTGKLSNASSRANTKSTKTPGGNLRRQGSTMEAAADLAQLSKTLTVTFDTVPDPAVADTASYLDAINYFCEMALQEAMGKLKQKGAKKKPPSPEGPKNTVLVLPQLIPGERRPLVRLGESHTDQLRASRQQTANKDSDAIISRDYTQPASMQPLRNYQLSVGGGFPLFMRLPLKPCLVAPFGVTEDDWIEWESTQSVMITLRCANKYFVPALSCPPQAF